MNIITCYIFITLGKDIIAKVWATLAKLYLIYYYIFFQMRCDVTTSIAANKCIQLRVAL